MDKENKTYYFQKKIKDAIQSFDLFLFKERSIFPLITFRIVFGALMCFGTLRFIQKGWVDKLFIEPSYHFKFYGFEWVQVLEPNMMYMIHYVIALSAFFILLGFLYRISILVFFLSFTYVELIDATNYLNHYYLVVLLAFLMIFLPANRAFSLDALLFPKIIQRKIPAICIYILMFQFMVVYFFAGYAKLNTDWLFRAMPLSIWLPEHTDIPILGYFFQFGWVAFVFSWMGAVYDLSIGFLLCFRKTRSWAYALVVAFHFMTYLLFNIGMFPFIMTFGTLIFFSDKWHNRLYEKFLTRDYWGNKVEPHFNFRLFIRNSFIFYTLIQILFPLRYLIYPGNNLWHEQGYRFAWRVMLVEKTGTAIFMIEDKTTGKKAEIQNSKYLTKFQEKQMSIQPDFMLQFAKIIANDFKERYGIEQAKVTANIHVALNNRPSQQLIEPNANVLDLKDTWRNKEWILPFKNK